MIRVSIMHIIDPQSKSEKAMKFLSGVSPQVKAALIAATVAMTLAVGGALGWVIQYWHYGTENARLKKDNDQLKQDKQELKDQLKAVTADRDTQLTRLAPFLAAADKKFTNNAPDERLTLLVESISKTLQKAPAFEFFVNDLRLGTNEYMTMPTTNGSYPLVVVVNNIGELSADRIYVSVGLPKELNVLESAGWNMGSSAFLTNDRVNYVEGKFFSAQSEGVVGPNRSMIFSPLTIQETNSVGIDSVNFVRLSATARNAIMFQKNIWLHLTNGTNLPHLGY